MSKGISPLIAAIILVGLVIAVANIVSPFFLTFLKSRQEGVKEASQEQISCIYSGVDFTKDDIKHNLTTSSDSVNITVRNTGSTSLYDFQVALLVDTTFYVYDPTIATRRNSTIQLAQGSVFVLVTNVTDDLSGTLKTVRVVAKNCPQNAMREVDL